MKFIVSSAELSAGLQPAAKVILGKNSLPILDNFLFVLKGNTLTVTASDMETTIKNNIEIAEVISEGEIAIPARHLSEAMKEFPDQPLEFSVNEDSHIIEIKWINGHSQLPYLNADEYPSIPDLNDNHKTLEMQAEVLLEGISRTQYATADEELRPAMNGIYFDFAAENLTMVATDAHKLACYTRHDIKSPDVSSSFILQKKPAGILKSILAKNTDPVKIKYDNKNIYFEYNNCLLASRLVEGNFPAYRSIIPKNNSNHLIIGKSELLHATKRVSICSNQATSLIKLSITTNQINISAQDLDFSLAANEDIKCQYEGDHMEIGFKSTILIDILSNIPYEDVCLQLYDPSRAALIVSAYPPENKSEECSALIMPMMINA